MPDSQAVAQHVQAVVQIISQLPDLGALAAATLATDVAYLSLTRFRYREEMRKCAKGQLAALGDETKLPKSIRGTSQYRELLYLAGLPDNDGLDRAKGHQNDTSKKCPEGYWSFFYKILFAYHEDLILTWITAGISVWTLIVGGAHTVKIWSALLPYSAGGWAEFIFWLLAIGMIFPAVSVILGHHVVKAGCNHALEAGKELANVLSEIVSAAAPPQNAQPPNPAVVQNPAEGGE